MKKEDTRCEWEHTIIIIVIVIVIVSLSFECTSCQCLIMVTQTIMFQCGCVRIRVSAKHHQACVYIVQLEITHPTPLKICSMLILFLPHLLCAVFCWTFYAHVCVRVNTIANEISIRIGFRKRTTLYLLWNNIYPNTNWLCVFIGSMRPRLWLNNCLKEIFPLFVGMCAFYPWILFFFLSSYPLAFPPLPDSNERYIHFTFVFT